MQKIKKKHTGLRRKGTLGGIMNLNSMLQKIKCLKKNLVLNKKSGDLQGTTHPDKLPNSEMELKATQTMKKHIKDIKSELNVIKQESEEQAPASSRTL